jgi:hypothetical protein
MRPVLVALVEVSVYWTYKVMTQVVGLAVLHNAAWDGSAGHWCITDAGFRLFICHHLAARPSVFR